MMLMAGVIKNGEDENKRGKNLILKGVDNICDFLYFLIEIISAEEAG